MLPPSILYYLIEPSFLAYFFVADYSQVPFNYFNLLSYSYKLFIGVILSVLAANNAIFRSPSKMIKSLNNKEAVFTKNFKSNLQDCVFAFQLRFHCRPLELGNMKPDWDSHWLFNRNRFFYDRTRAVLFSANICCVKMFKSFRQFYMISISVSLFVFVCIFTLPLYF